MGLVCKKCGNDIKGGSKFCANCGTEVENKVEEIQNDEVAQVQNNIPNQGDSEADKKAKTGFTLGMCSIIAWLLPLAGYPVTICGIVFSIKGLESKTNNGKAIAGLVLSIIFLILTLTNSILGVISYMRTLNS